MALWRAGERAQAQRLCESLLSGSQQGEALDLLAEIYSHSGQLAQAGHCLQQLVTLVPTDAALRRRYAQTQLAMGQLLEAVASYQDALAIDPTSVRAHNNLGQALLRLNREAEAMASFEQALALDPNYAPAHNNRGEVLLRTGKWTEAAESFQRAIALAPNLLEAHVNCGRAQSKLGQMDAAIACYRRALAINPQSPEATRGMADALQAMERNEEAWSCYQQALQRSPNHPELLSNAANVLLQLQRPEEALALCDRALQQRADLPEVHNNRGGALRQLRRPEEALACFDEALALRVDYAAAHSNRGNALLMLGNIDEALASCDRAIALQPQLADAHANRAAALMTARRPAEAARSYEQLLALEPHFPHALGALVDARSLCGDWRDYDQNVELLRSSVEEGGDLVHPFMWLTMMDSAPSQLRCARAFVRSQKLDVGVPLPPPAPYRHQRIRVAYLSADFHAHATGELAAGLFEQHDRAAFEIYGVSFGPDDGSAMRARLHAAFDEFVDVRGVSDLDVARWMRQREIDIAVDLKGYTQDGRVRILTHRPAPVQVSFLGYPGTLALPQIDYLIADPVVVPIEDRAHYSEQIVHLPGSYQVNDGKRVIAERIWTREECGLPQDAFVFCCFNNSFKITPAVFDCWLEILRQQPGSVLWLLESNSAVTGNLKARAEAAGVAAERLVFSPRVPTPDHLSRQRLADLCLDTLPYNGHTTTSDALWVGVPVVTCCGSAFAGRVAASLLRAAGLPELVTDSRQDYQRLALQFARDPARLAFLRERLQRQRAGCALFDTGRYCRHLEQAYRQMWLRAERGEPPTYLCIDPKPVPATA